MAEPIPKKEIEGGYELPEGWVWATIGDACEINPKSSNLSDLDQSLPTTFVPMSAVDQMEGVIETPEVLSLGKARKGHTHFIENDVIFAKITPCMENGKVAIAKNLVNGLGFGSTEFHVIRSPQGVIPKFVFYFLRQDIFRKEASAHFTSTVGQMRVPKAFMMDAPFPLPPLAEQRRIAAKLEAIMAQVNAAKDHLAAVPPIIKRFRQSVLAAACSGRLTEYWRREHPDVEPASELLKRIREERIRRYEAECQKAKAGGRRKPKKPKNIVEPQEVEAEGLLELPEGWAWTTLGDVTDLTSGIAFKKKEYAEQGIRLFQIANVSFGEIVWANIAYLPLGYLEKYPDLVLKVGDILMALNRPILNGELKIGMLKENDVPAILYQRVGRFDFYAPSFKYYFFYYLQSLFFINRLTKSLQGVDQPFINKPKLLDVHIPLPSILEQRAIVNRIETLFHRTSEVEERVAAATSHADRLTQSILAKAFRGELVPQDPDDEPASVLLERIRKERTELKKKPQKRRSKTPPDSN